MRNSATSFRRRGFWAAAVVAAQIVCVGVRLDATVLITVEEALELAFPNAETVRETLFLTDDQIRSAASAAELEIDGAMVTRFVARSGDEVVGFAYLDTHRVRTLPETVVVILDGGGKVRRVEVAAFREPLDYKPGESWYRQFDGEELDRDLSLDRDIRPITGATLTARATTEAVRRVLAIHQAVTGDGGAP
jgi:Na+-translocating ferredoxin:NAD+ oxidoreductase RnfG subunit